jgi:hypothetical protein
MTSQSGAIQPFTCKPQWHGEENFTDDSILHLNSLTII